MTSRVTAPHTIVKPAQVSAQAWATLPVEDRAAVLPLAGTMAMRGFEPDDAIAMGMLLLRHARLLARPMGRTALRALSAVYDECHGDAVPRSAQLTAACEALVTVAESSKASDTDALRSAIAMGAWQTSGECAVCGNAVTDEEQAWRGMDLHKKCLPSMRRIAIVFRETALNMCGPAKDLPG